MVFKGLEKEGEGLEKCILDCIPYHGHHFQGRLSLQESTTQPRPAPKGNALKCKVSNPRKKEKKKVWQRERERESMSLLNFCKP